MSYVLAWFGYLPCEVVVLYVRIHVLFLVFGPLCRFVFLRTCGCVFSERALKEVPSETCHKCGKPFSASDVYVINGEEEDVRRQEAAAEEAKKQSKVAKVCVCVCVCVC